MREIEVRGQFITLGQLMKLVGEVNSGAEVKQFLADNRILVNGQPDDRRGRKLRAGDMVTCPTVGSVRLIAGEIQ